MYFVSTGFSNWTEHISFILGSDLRNSSFSAYLLWEYLVVPKRTEFLFWLEFFFFFSSHSLEVDGWGVACSSGEAARDPVGVLPSASSFFSAFSILLHCVSSLLMAAPCLRSISLEVEMPNFAATSLNGIGLIFLSQAFSSVLLESCQLHVPYSQDSFKQLCTPKFL